MSNPCIQYAGENRFQLESATSGRHYRQLVVNVPVAEIVEIHNGLVEYDWDGLIERRIRTASPELSLEGLRTSGYDFELVAEKLDYVKKSDAAREVVSAEYSVGLVIKKKDGEVSVVTPNGIADQAGLADGMKILGVNGMKFTPKRFDEALEDTPTNNGMQLLVEEGEAYRVVSLKYAGGPKYPSLRKIDGQQDWFGAICSPGGKTFPTESETLEESKE